MAERFAIGVAKENLKFSAAHFIAYPGFREPLHGHNYQVSVRVEGQLGPQGYVLDFGLVKRIVGDIVAGLNERTIVPALSDCLRIETIDNSKVAIHYNQEQFVLPAADVRLLPIVHSSAEELARFIWTELRATLVRQGQHGGILALEVSVAEAPGQFATYCADL